MGIKRHIKENWPIYIGIGIPLVLLGGQILYNFGPKSRRTFNPKGMKLEQMLPEDFEKMVNVSSGGSEGDLMLTYQTTNGNYVTREYNRCGLWETEVKWTVPQEGAK